MRKQLLLRSFLIWAGIFVIAFINGALREFILKTYLTESTANHLSALTAILFITIFCYFSFSYLNLQSKKESFQIGFLWFVMTFFVETFVLNRWIGNLNWEQIVQTYNISAGNLWPLVLITIGVLPAALWKWSNQNAVEKAS